MKTTKMNFTQNLYIGFYGTFLSRAVSYNNLLQDV